MGIGCVEGEEKNKTIPNESICSLQGDHACHDLHEMVVCMPHTSTLNARGILLKCNLTYKQR